MDLQQTHTHIQRIGENFSHTLVAGEKGEGKQDCHCYYMVLHCWGWGRGKGCSRWFRSLKLVEHIYYICKIYNI